MRRFQPRSPFDPLLRLQDALDRVFDNPVGQWWDVGPSGRGVFPPLNVFGDADGYTVRLEVPGLKKQEISIESKDHTLTLAGKRSTDRATGSAHRRERWTGEFSRSLQLPEDGDPSRAEARYARGVLTVRVPRREESKPRQIAVSS